METNSLVKVIEQNAIDYTGSFGDKRIEKRGEKIVKELVKKETAVLNQFSDSRADLGGGSRFFLVLTDLVSTSSIPPWSWQ